MWRRLQPARFDTCKDLAEKAEAHATKSKEQFGLEVIYPARLKHRSPLLA
jgi:hypothetical protein